MNDANVSQTPGQSQLDRWLKPGSANVEAIYVLYLASLFLGFTSIIGVVLAYVNRGQAEDWVETHYTWAIRTFWIGLVAGVISFFLIFVLVGILTALAAAVWMIVRCVVGLQAVSKGEPIRNPESWLI